MKISKILKGKNYSLSFEVFPPKTSSSFESVREATEKIAALSPSYMSVTYGAGGGTSKYTLDIAKNIQEKYNVPTLAHLTCVSSSKETVRERIADIKAAGIKNVMALRGDIPEGMEDTPRDYKYAIELIRELRESGGDFCIGGACYPEGHPESPSLESDIRYLKEKMDAGLDFLTTQMFFDFDPFFKFMVRASRADIDTSRIIPGIMPITSVSQVERVVKISGCRLPKVFTDMIDKYGQDPEIMKIAGMNYAIHQILTMFQNGFKNVHVYSMNKPDVATEIFNYISDTLEYNGKNSLHKKL